MKRALIACIALSLVSTLPAMADDDSGGIGAMLGSTDGQTEGAIVFEGNLTRQDLQGASDHPIYGNENATIELFSNWGISLRGYGGRAMTGLHEGDAAALHLGVEPLNLNLSWNSNDDRKDFIEWSPMVSVGPQVAIAACRALLLGRAGGSLGTLGGGGFRPTYGAGANLNCPAFDIDASVSRVLGKDHPVDLATADVSVKLTRKFSIGLRGEGMVDRDPMEAHIIFSKPETGERVEYRGFIVLRGQAL